MIDFEGLTAAEQRAVFKWAARQNARFEAETFQRNGGKPVSKSRKSRPEAADVNEARVRRLELALADLQKALPANHLDTGRRIDAVARTASEAARKAEQALSDRAAVNILHETHKLLNQVREVYEGRTLTELHIREAPHLYREALKDVGVPDAKSLPLLLRNIIIAIGLLCDSRDEQIERTQRIIRRSNYKFNRLNQRLTQVEAHLGCPERPEPDGQAVGEDGPC